MSANFNRTNRSRIAFVCITLMLFSLIFGYLVFSTYAGYRPLQQLPRWQGAQPISTDKALATGYFRRQFLLASEPDRAYLVVSGTDEVTVFVNGDLVGTSRYFGAKTSEILDITRFLQRGDNLLAIAVSNRASEAKPELTARLELLLPDGSSKTLLTDRDWRAKGSEDYQPSRHAAWNSPDFVDLDWSSASVNPSPDARPTYPYRVQEKIYQAFPDGYWIWQESANNLNATFLREFQINTEEITGAWLGVSVTGNYSITLNGLPLYSHAGSLRNMELFDIGPYVNAGDNRLLIHVESDVTLPKLAISGMVTTATGLVEFSSDGRWRSLVHTKNQRAAPKDEAVIVMAQLRDGSAGSNLTLNFKEIEIPAVMTLQRATQFVIITLLLFVMVATSLGLLHLLSRFYDPIPLWKDLETLALPFLLGSVILVVLLIMSYDIRIGNHAPFQPFVLFSIAIIVLLWEGYIMFERIDLRRSADG